jgi:MraZ protein
VGCCGSNRGEAVFSGRYDHTIDDKGRVSIPARFREILERDGLNRLYITNFISEQGRCLELFPPSEWERVVGKIRQNNSFDRNVQLFQTFYIGGAHDVQVDRQGRILIPPKLREFARLEHEVTFSAMIDRFQLWDRSTLEKVLSAAEESLKDPKFFQNLNL